MHSPNLPKNWQKAPLSMLSDVQTGIAKGKRVKGSPISLPYLRVANVQDGYVDLSVIKEITVEQADVERYSLRDGDVLFTEGGGFDKLGRGTVWQGQIAPCLHQNHIFVVRPKVSLLLPEFLAYQAASEYGRRYFQLSSKRSTIASIDSTQLKEFPVLLPPLPEQRKIAEILRTWDEAIEKLERLRVAKAKKLEHLSWRLIHGDHYQEVRLQDLLTRGVCIEKGMVLTREKSLPGPYAVIGGGQSSSYSHCRYTHKPPCITVSASGTAGFVWRHREPIWASDCHVLTTNSLSLDYIFFALKTQQKKLYSLQSGGAQPHIYSKDILSLKIPFPSDEMQEKIAKFLNAATEEAVLLNQQVIALTRQKRGLMQKLLTGKWRTAA
ncbi:hypothetical protein NKDENANG_03775 [Candidatus Entotheonellaceae bacterium PAL068K]